MVGSLVSLALQEDQGLHRAELCWSYADPPKTQALHFEEILQFIVCQNNILVTAASRLRAIHPLLSFVCWETQGLVRTSLKQTGALSKAVQGFWTIPETQTR